MFTTNEQEIKTALFDFLKPLNKGDIVTIWAHDMNEGLKAKVLRVLKGGKVEVKTESGDVAIYNKKDLELV